MGRRGRGDGKGRRTERKKSYTIIINRTIIIIIIITGRANEPPHWAVQSRFRMIYIHVYMSVCRFVYDSMGNPYKKKRMPKCVGGFP